MSNARMTTKEAAAYLGKSKSWLDSKMRKEGRENDPTFHLIVRPFKIGKTNYYMKSELDAYVAAHQSDKTPIELRAESLATRFGFDAPRHVMDFALTFLEAYADRIERENYMITYDSRELRNALCQCVDLPADKNFRKKSEDGG